MANNNEFLESTPFALDRFPRLNIRDLPQDYHDLREWFHACNPECLPIKTSPLYCKADCAFNDEGAPHDLACHKVNTNDWKQFRFSCPACRKIYPGVPVFFANFREKLLQKPCFKQKINSNGWCSAEHNFIKLIRNSFS